MDFELDGYETDSVSSDLESYLYSLIHYEPTQESNYSEPVVQSSPTVIDLSPIRKQCNSFTKLKSNSVLLKRSGDSPPHKKTTLPSIVDPVVKVFQDGELRAEKENRRKPEEKDGKQSFSVTKHLASQKLRRTPPKKKKVVSDSSSESDVVVESVKVADEPFVINVDSSSDDSVIIVEDDKPNVVKDKTPIVVEDEPLKKKVPDGPLWQINVEDRFKTRTAGMMSVRCHNCDERGHLSKSCNKPKRVTNCYQCGEPGHSGDRCENPICSRCLFPGHQQAHCRWMPSNIPPCPLCHFQGHLSRECPSIWRRFHLTTSEGPLVTTSKYACHQTRTSNFCYNCGREGHYGHCCTRKRRFKFVFPVDRVVEDYRDPRKIVFNNANTKSWNKKLQLAARSAEDVQQGIEHTPQPRSKKRRIAHQPAQQQTIVHQPQKKGRKWSRINPTAETAFPRTKKINRTNFQNHIKDLNVVKANRKRQKKKNVSNFGFY